jgi:hypothetical protein
MYDCDVWCKNFNMKSNFLIIFLIAVIGVGAYFFGRKMGKSDIESTITQNVNVIKKIAELGALQVNGTTNIKISNKGNESSNWSKFKNYFAENTLQVNVPYSAKYGIDMSNKQFNLDANKKIITLTLPSCKLLSMQLQLDKMETMSQTGVFASASMSDLVKAQKDLYAEALKQLENNPAQIKLAQQHIQSILADYYAPFGYEVKCVFEEVKLMP